MNNYLHYRENQYEKSLIAIKDRRSYRLPPLEEIRCRIIDELLESDLARNYKAIGILEDIGVLKDTIRGLARNTAIQIISSYISSIPSNGAKRMPEKQVRLQNDISDPNAAGENGPFNYASERNDERQLARILFSEKEEEKFIEIRSSLKRVVYSLIRTSDASISREIYFQILENKDAFGRLASEYSEGPEKYTRGIIGPVKSDQGHPEITRYLRSADKGKPSRPFAVGGWWIILRLEAVIDSELDRDTRTSISHMMYCDWAEDIADKTTELIRLRYANEE